MLDFLKRELPCHGQGKVAIGGRVKGGQFLYSCLLDLNSNFELNGKEHLLHPLQNISSAETSLSSLKVADCSEEVDLAKGWP